MEPVASAPVGQRGFVMSVLDQTPRLKLEAARRWLCIKMPYLTSVLYHHVYSEAPDLGTFGVTSDSIILWDPACVVEWSVAEIGAVLLHEVSHTLRNHAGRLGHRDPKLWNTAADCEINDDIAAAEIALPLADLVQTPRRHGLPDGKTAEWYYEQLTGSDEQAAAGGSGGGLGDQPCGSGAGNPHPDEDRLAEAARASGLRGRSSADQDLARRQTAAAIQEASSRVAGSVPAGLCRWADLQVPRGVVRWEDKLARAVRRATTFRSGLSDYTYTRLNRHQHDFCGMAILPSMHSPVPKVLVAVDTSGSMAQSELSAALGELDGIFKAVRAEVDFCACDAKVHALERVRTAREAARLLKGGGGTSFRPIFEAVAERRPRPDVVVVATDGWGSAPSQPIPGVHTIWLLIGEGARAPVSWGSVVEVPA